MYRNPNEAELRLIWLVASRGGTMDHEDDALAEFCDDASTLTKPDVFNACHDLGWLISSHDDRTDASFVRVTKLGRECIAVDQPLKE